MMLTCLGIGRNGYCGQLPETRELGAGMRKPRTCLPPSQHRPLGRPCCPRCSGTKPRIVGLLPLGSCYGGCCYRNTSRTHWAETKHPSWTRTGAWLGPLPQSPWQHAGSRMASNQRGAGILTPSRGSRRPGVLLRGSLALLASAGARLSARAAPRRARGGAGSVSPPARTPSSP